jgi:transposase, IS30 family
MSYSHLSARERMGLFYMHQSGYSLREIGRRLGRSHTSLSRELNRNARPIGSCYCDRYAQQRAEQRRAIPRHYARHGHEELHSYVNAKVNLGWSPEIIANRIKRDYPRKKSMRISHETVYQWLYRDAAAGGSAYQQLVRAHKKRKRRCKYGQCRGLIPNRTDISQRPEAVNRRQRYGHWEGDTLVGGRRQGRMVTHVERKSRYLLARLIDDGTAERFNQASQACYSSIPAMYRRTLTLDNGKENARHDLLSRKLNIRIYFARPYASWERGTNENTNGLIRRFFPKSTNFLTSTKRQLDKVVHLLNHRPRKCLNYQTPFEVFNKVTGGALAT